MSIFHFGLSRARHNFLSPRPPPFKHGGTCPPLPMVAHDCTQLELNADLHGNFASELKRLTNCMCNRAKWTSSAKQVYKLWGTWRRLSHTYDRPVLRYRSYIRHAHCSALRYDLWFECPWWIRVCVMPLGGPVTLENNLYFDTNQSSTNYSNILMVPVHKNPESWTPDTSDIKLHFEIRSWFYYIRFACMSVFCRSCQTRQVLTTWPQQLQ